MLKSGTADLPLHGGHLPQWLYTRMSKLAREIISIIVQEYGTDEVLRRLSDPFWFQAFGCVLGMDWHSSGITSSVISALKTAINPISHELGIYICGGKGKYSRKTPEELNLIAQKQKLNSCELVRASKLTAKVDNSCILDGFNLYLHSFIVSMQGKWVVVQQGMNEQTGMARRYHWHSDNVKSFVDNPHTAIIGKNKGKIINLSDTQASQARKAIVDFMSQSPAKQLKEIRHLCMSKSHNNISKYVNKKRLAAVLMLAYSKGLKEFTEALMLEGVGPRTMQALALISEIIYGAPCRFDDPARFSFAHGGKDGVPAPVPLKIYDKSITILKDTIKKAKINHYDKIKSIKIIDKFVRYIEQYHNPAFDINDFIAFENTIAPLYNGRTVKTKKPPKNTQLSLFYTPPLYL